MYRVILITIIKNNTILSSLSNIYKLSNSEPELSAQKVTKSISETELSRNWNPHVSASFLKKMLFFLNIEQINMVYLTIL